MDSLSLYANDAPRKSPAARTDHETVSATPAKQPRRTLKYLASRGCPRVPPAQRSTQRVIHRQVPEGRSGKQQGVRTGGEKTHPSSPATQSHITVGMWHASACPRPVPSRTSDGLHMIPASRRPEVNSEEGLSDGPDSSGGTCKNPENGGITRKVRRLKGFFGYRYTLHWYATRNGEVLGEFCRSRGRMDEVCKLDRHRTKAGAKSVCGAVECRDSRGFLASLNFL